MTAPSKGEIWRADLDPIVGREQGGSRPCVIVSADAYNRLPISMAIVVPLTTRYRGLTHQVLVAKHESGLDQESYARPEDVRAVSRERLRQRLGHVSVQELSAISATLRAFLDL